MEITMRQIEAGSKVSRVLLNLSTSWEGGRSIVLGTAKYIRLHGPWITESRDHTSSGSLSSVINRWKPDGLISGPVKHPESLASLGIPVIYLPNLHKDVPGCYCVHCNNFKTGEMAADYFLQRGYRNFLFCGVENYFWSEKRLEGFSERLTEHGYSTKHVSYSAKNWMYRSSELEKVLLKMPKPFAVFACADICGRNILNACTNIHLRVPEEVAVLGVDDNKQICELCSPSLSSVHLNFLKTGYEAAELLDEMMNGRAPSREILIEPTHITPRQSTDVLAIDDEDVIAAIRFIRQNYEKLIQAEEVAQETGLSRVTLERRFQTIFGHSITDQINTNKIEHICALLLETDMPISQIAYRLGFNSDQNFARYFRQHKGTTPLQYRKTK